MTNSLTLMMRRVLYQLKREYGFRVEIFKLVSSDTDVRTGVKTTQTTRFVINRAVVLPEMLNRTTKQSISLISSNKEFVSGGTSDIGTRNFIVDRRDVNLPELTADDWLVYNHYKYQIKYVQAFEENAGWIIQAKRISGEEPDTLSASAEDSVEVTDEAEEDDGS
ncbi:MAG: hypothetical protein WD005_05065 [Haliea sp.]